MQFNIEDYQDYLFDDNEVPVELVENSLAQYNDIIEGICTTLFITLNHSQSIDDEKTYTDAIKAVMKKIHRKYCDKIAIDYYFERAPQSNKLHVHGMFLNVPITYSGYDGISTYIMKEFHKLIGRKYIPHSVCALCEETRCYTAVSAYCSKSKGINHTIYRSGKTLIHHQNIKK